RRRRPDRRQGRACLASPVEPRTLHTLRLLVDGTPGQSRTQTPSLPACYTCAPGSTRTTRQRTGCASPQAGHGQPTSPPLQPPGRTPATGYLTVRNPFLTVHTETPEATAPARRRPPARPTSASQRGTSMQAALRPRSQP